MRDKKQKIKKIIEIFNKEYPEPKTELNYSNTFELLIAVILSAQTTDKQVNRVTHKLFKEYNKPEDFASLTEKELQKKIKSIGLYRNKSKYIIKTGKIINNEFNGQIPSTRKELMKLPGVGRKTANVVLACGFDKNTIAVDTHVFRVSKRIGLTEGINVNKTEEQLQEIIPEERWQDMHHWLIFHGRYICKARKPECNKCKIINLCNYKNKRI